MLLEGIFLPLTTPFHPDGRLYLSKLESNVRRYSLTSAAGMLVAGGVGEAAALTDAETHAVLQTAIAAAADEKVMIACVGRSSVFATLELAAVAAAAGYDVIAAGAPPGLDLQQTQLYFETLADQARLPLVLESAAVPLPLELVVKLASHPNIIGVIDTLPTPERVKAIAAGTAGISREVTVTTIFAAVTGRMQRLSKQAGTGIISEADLRAGATVATLALPALKTRSKRVGFHVLAGSAATMLDAWRAGAHGAVPTLAACAPQACAEVWQAFRDGDDPLAAEKQDRIRTVATRTEGFDGIAALKFGCDLNGYFGGRPRLPLVPLDPEERAILQQDLSSLRT